MSDTSRSPIKAFGTLALALLCSHSLQAQVDVESAPPIPSYVFVPPPPPKSVPVMKVEAATTRWLPTHHVTVLRGEPSTLPDIPPPPAPKPHVSGPSGQSGHCLFFGVTVYDHRLSHVSWQGPRTGENFEAWCAWDWTLLSPMSEVMLGASVGMVHVFASNIDTTDKLHHDEKIEMQAHLGLEPNAFAITEGDPGDADAIRVLSALRDHYLEHLDRLLLIRKAREEYQAAADAWYAANPPKPQNHTFWLRPHRGSRYLKGEGDVR